MKTAILVAITMVLVTVNFQNSAYADEPVRSERELRKRGYRPFAEFQKHYPLKGRLDLKKLLKRKNVLPWPVDFLDINEPIGNSMIQFQDYGYPYYHGGCDLISKDGWWVTTPVSGFLEGGHYSYTGNPDGSMNKFWIPWPKRGSDAYFEIAIVTDEGLRFEFHHVDRDSLPEEIVAALNKGRVRIEAGTKIGKVYEWGAWYDHIHYNIVTPEGLRINPEFVSDKLNDQQAPEVDAVLAIYPGEKVVEFKGGRIEKPLEFIVAGVDRKNPKSKFLHPFHSTLLKFKSGSVVGWDYRAVMKTLNGKWPPIFEYFLMSLKAPNGRKLKTFGDYGDGYNLIRLPVPAGANGEFMIEVADMSGNQKTFRGEM